MLSKLFMQNMQLDCMHQPPCHGRIIILAFTLFTELKILRIMFIFYLLD